MSWKGMCKSMETHNSPAHLLNWKYLGIAGAQVHVNRARKMDRHVDLEYADLAWLAKVVAIVRSDTVTTYQLHDKYHPASAAYNTNCLHVWGSWLSGSCWYWLGSFSCLRIGWVSAYPGVLRWDDWRDLILLCVFHPLVGWTKHDLMGIPGPSRERAQSFRYLFSLCLCHVC